MPPTFQVSVCQGHKSNIYRLDNDRLSGTAYITSHSTSSETWAKNFSGSPPGCQLAKMDFTSSKLGYFDVAVAIVQMLTELIEDRMDTSQRVQ